MKTELFCLISAGSSSIALASYSVYHPEYANVVLALMAIPLATVFYCWLDKPVNKH